MKKTTTLMFVLGLMGGCDTLDTADRAGERFSCPEAGPEICGSEGSTGGDSGSRGEGEQTEEKEESEDGSTTGDDSRETGDSGDDDCPCGDEENGDGQADLPYNYDVALGDEVLLMNAFLEKGSAPSEITSVTMSEGGDWRLDELVNGVPFLVTQEDCDHEGNKGEGRDRLEVSWINADGSTDSDHMSIRYCDD